MAIFGQVLGVSSLQVVLAASLISVVVCASLPLNKEQPLADSNAMEYGRGFPPVTNLRAKRYIGWGRRPGMRYAKATSAFDMDRVFNTRYNKYEKRGQSAPESPIASSFREVRLKQKVPNAQLLLPHLFNRSSRLPAGEGAAFADGNPAEFGLMDLNDEDMDALMYILEEYARARNANDV